MKASTMLAILKDWDRKNWVYEITNMKDSVGGYYVSLGVLTGSPIRYHAYIGDVEAATLERAILAANRRAEKLLKSEKARHARIAASAEELKKNQIWEATAGIDTILSPRRQITAVANKNSKFAPRVQWCDLSGMCRKSWCTHAGFSRWIKNTEAKRDLKAEKNFLRGD